MPKLTHGKLIKIGENAYRITAPNPGPMTAEGTNTYLFGSKSIAVVDPGPDIEQHVNAILAGIEQIGGTLTDVFVTHTHRDHSPAAKPLIAKYPTPVRQIGMLPPDEQFQDVGFEPDLVCTHGQIFETNEYRLRALHTPGHVGNHFCFLDETNRLLLAGDHIMNGSTVVIVPPGGDMLDYIASLKLLLDYDIEFIAPAHGDLMPDPAAEIDKLVQHRLGREAKVVEKLAAAGKSSIDDLVPLVYDDVDPSLHSFAYYSLWAHLIKLDKEQRASVDQDIWQLIT